VRIGRIAVDMHLDRVEVGGSDLAPFDRYHRFPRAHAR
jgi:hypothetical protein